MYYLPATNLGPKALEREIAVMMWGSRRRGSGVHPAAARGFRKQKLYRGQPYTLIYPHLPTCGSNGRA
jgi:hypothetical protein